MPNQKELQEIFENIDQLEIGLKDSFRFECRRCGNCCRNREDILLPPRDLFRIAKYLGKSNAEIIKSYCEMYVGELSRIPLVRLRPAGPNKDCPLLGNNHCIVHSAKPAVCALFPLGRFMQFASEDGLNQDDNMKIRYLLNPNPCGGRQYNKVSRWLKAFGIETDDKAYLLWAKTTSRLGIFIKNLEKAEKKIPDVGFDALWTVAYQLLYVKYDTDKEFIPQFEANAAEMWRVINDMDAKIVQPFLKGEFGSYGS